MMLLARNAWTSVGPVVLAAVLTATAPAALAAPPAALGEVFLAGDLDVADEYVDRRCVTGTGVSVMLSEWQSGSLTPYSTAVIERTEADGTELPPIIVNSPQPIAYPAAVTCASDGSFLIQLHVASSDADDSTRLVRAYDASGQPRGAFFPLTDSQNDSEGFLAIHADAGIYHAWVASDGDKFGLYGRRLDYDGNELSPHARLGTLQWPSEGTIAFDEPGNVIVAWVAYEGDCRVFAARIVDAGGVALGDPILLSEPFCLRADSPHADLASEGIFRVTWQSPAHGGRLARLVSMDPEQFPGETVTTTTLPASDEVSFVARRSFGAIDAEYGSTHVTLASDGAQGRLVAWRRLQPNEYYPDEFYGQPVMAASTDSGRTWRQTDNVYWGDNLAIAMSPSGTWIYAGTDSPGAVLARTTRDGGTTWSDRVIASWPDDADDIALAFSGFALATDGSGTWTAAWHQSRYTRQPRKYLDDAVAVSLSYDDGETWSPPNVIWTGSLHDTLDVGVATDSDGTWMVAWQEEAGHRIQVARSRNDGWTWEPAAIVLDLPGKGFPHRDENWRQSMSLVHVNEAAWLVSFMSSNVDRKRFGADGDIFVLRTDDDGTTWSAPLPVNATAPIDGATDMQPAIAAGAGGSVAAVWQTFDPLGGPLEDSPDIAVAHSDDGGLTWSWPGRADRTAPDVVGQSYPAIAGGADGTWLAAWQEWPRDADWWENPHSLQIAVAPGVCGDGVVLAAEHCDDANDVDGDGCDSDCTTGCGNGIRTAGEECDDGNPFADDECLGDCRLAACGDGVVHLGVEECDDAATVTTGFCLPDCSVARCGDGFVAPDEQCDDGNESNEDECTNDCAVPVCGDRILLPGVEECDDGTHSDTDACVEGCRHATCGDGFVWAGVEECEPAKPLHLHPCNSDCRWLRACADGTSAGINATAALSVLRFAVGLPGPCTIQVCDIDGSGRVTTSDALKTLRAAVGSLSITNCTEVARVRFELDDARAIGALQFRARHTWFVGAFQDADGSIDCTLLHPAMLSATNSTAPNEVRAGFVAVPAVTGPFPLMECSFRHPAGQKLRPRDVRIELEDWSDDEFQRLDPPPKIRVRVLD